MKKEVSKLIENSEILEILGYMDKQYVEKVPKKLLELFEKNKLEGYEPHISHEIPLNEQNISKKTIAMLALLYLDYWCKDENEKQELVKLFKKNEIIHQRELMEKYNPDNLFKNRKKVDVKEVEENIGISSNEKLEETKEKPEERLKEKILENKKTEDTALVEYKKERLFKRILSKIFHFFFTEDI